MLGSRPLYIYVLFAAFLGVLLPLVVRKLARPLLSGRPSTPTPHIPHGNLGSRINVRFFLGILVSGLLTASILVVMPLLIHLRQMPDPSAILLTTVCILSFTLIGLLYAIRKSDLSWGKSLIEMDEERKKP